MTCNMFSESGEVVGLDVRRFPSCLVSLTTKLRRHENSSDRLDEHQQSTMHMYIYIYYIRLYIYIYPTIYGVPNLLDISVLSM